MKLALAAAAAILLLAAPAAGAPPPVDAGAVFIQNGTTGEVLYRFNEREPVAVASITKLMTALLTLQHARLDDVVIARPEAASVGESTIGLQPGEQLTVRELLQASLIQSANDATWALAYHVGGGDVDRFVEMMNDRARRLGLRDTHFERPDGLDAPGHVSSARDVTKLARVAMRKPVIREVVAMQTAEISGGRTLVTWNDLLATFPGLIGVKTGHTSEAGWSQVAAARGRGLTLYATLLGGPTREQRNADLAGLLSWGLSQYRYAPIVQRGRVYAVATAGYGRGDVKLVAARPAFRAVRAGRPLTEQVIAPRSVELPVERGERVGEVRVYERGRLVLRRPLVAARSVSEPNLARRVGWYVSETAENLVGFFS